MKTNLKRIWYLIKALKPQKPEPETPEPEAKPEIRVNKTKLKKLRKDFDEFRHKFSKKEIKEYRKDFYKLKWQKSFYIRNKRGRQKSY